jgi:hypothetical protein
LLVGEFVKSVQFPKLPGDAKANFFCGCHGWIVYQVKPEKLTILRVVGSSGQLDWSAAFVPLTVAWLRVTKIFATFVGRAGSNLFHVTKLARFMSQLS